MLIPSIDIINGKAVQLKQGKEFVLESERSPMELARDFNRCGKISMNGGSKPVLPLPIAA